MTNQYNKQQIDDQISQFPKHPELEKATSDLLTRFPEFKNSESFGQTDEAIPFLVFADFDHFLIKKIKEKQNEDLLKRAAVFINELYSSDNKNLKDLVISGIFETLANDPESQALIPHLSNESSEAFKKFFN